MSDVVDECGNESNDGESNDNCRSNNKIGARRREYNNNN